MVSAKEVRIEQIIFTDFWNILKKYYDNDFTEELSVMEAVTDLSLVADKVGRIGGNEKQAAFAFEISKAVIHYLTLKSGKGKEKDNDAEAAGPAPGVELG